MIYSYKQIFSIGMMTLISFCIAVGSVVPQKTDALTEIVIREEMKKAKYAKELEKDISDEGSIPIAEPVVEPVENTSNNVYFDIPLSTDLQDHIFELCKKMGLDASMVIAMISVESTYNSSLIGDSGESFGLMQIQPRWHSERMESLGCSNLLDPYQNVIVGVDFISELYTYGGKQRTTDWVLMAYNGGPSYANKKSANGEVSHYVNKVYNRQAKLTEV